MKTLIVISLCFLLASTATSQAQPQGLGIRGVVILAEHRYDPAVQRWLAAEELASLPLRDGQLYYVYPVQNSNAQLESMQIQYLEHLLDKRAQQEQLAPEPEE